jgi:predicted HicB family RNase H-like nuclease
MSQAKSEAEYDGNLTLELPPELYRSAELYAAKHGITLDEVVGRAITQLLDQYE